MGKHDRDEGDALPRLKLPALYDVDTLVESLIDLMDRLDFRGSQRSYDGARRFIMVERGLSSHTVKGWSALRLVAELRALCVERGLLGDLNSVAARMRRGRAADDNAAEGEGAQNLDPIAKAIGLMVADQSLSVDKLAEIVGVDRRRLYEDSRFKDVRRALREKRRDERADRARRIPKGSKDADGNLEAWTD